MKRTCAGTAILGILLTGCATIWDQVQVMPVAAMDTDRLAADQEDCRIRATVAGQSYAAGQPRDLAIAGAVAGVSAAAIAASAGALAHSRTTVGAAGVCGCANSVGVGGGAVKTRTIRSARWSLWPA